MKTSKPMAASAESLRCVTLPARLENLPRFIAPMLAVARQLRITAERRQDLELALEESLVNIIHSAFPHGSGAISVFARQEADRLVIHIVDEGVAFDPTAAGPPDLSTELAARPIGGLGIHLVRSLMDQVEYRREGDRNVLMLILHLPKEKETAS